jgi:hypothetical protein
LPAFSKIATINISSFVIKKVLPPPQIQFGRFYEDLICSLSPIVLRDIYRNKSETSVLGYREYSSNVITHGKVKAKSRGMTDGKGGMTLLLLLPVFLLGRVV